MSHPRGDAHRIETDRTVPTDRLGWQIMDRDERIDHRGSTGHRMALVQRDRKHAIDTLEWFAEHAASPTAGRRVGFAWSDDDRGQSRRAAVDETFACIIVDKHLSDRFGHSIGRLRGELGPIIAGVFERRSTEASDAAGKDESAGRPQTACGFEQTQAAVQVHAHGLVEAFLAFPADHRSQMKDGCIGSLTDRRIDRVLRFDTSDDLLDSDLLDSDRLGLWNTRSWKRRIEQDDFLDGLDVPILPDERLAIEQGFAELMA